jgi:hypothetical protein
VLHLRIRHILKKLYAYVGCQKKKERKKEKEKANSTRETDRTEHLITDPNNPAYVFHSPRALTNDPAT